MSWTTNATGARASEFVMREHHTGHKIKLHDRTGVHDSGFAERLCVHIQATLEKIKKPHLLFLIESMYYDERFTVPFTCPGVTLRDRLVILDVVRFVTRQLKRMYL